MIVVSLFFCTFHFMELVNVTFDRLLKVGFKKLYFKFKHKIKQI